MKAFEMAERLGGMTAYELMDRMSVDELLDWISYDQCHHDPADERNAMLLAKIDAALWRKGSPRPDPQRYLNKLKLTEVKKSLSVSEIRHKFDVSLGAVSMNTFGLKTPT